MNGSYDSGLRSDGILDLLLIDVHGIGTDVHKYRHRTAKRKCIGCGYECI